MIPLNQSAEFPDQGDVLADISAQLPELRIFLYKSLHVRYRVDSRGRLSERAGLIGVDVIFQRGTKITECRQVMCLEERISGGRESNFLSNV